VDGEEEGAEMLVVKQPPPPPYQHFNSNTTQLLSLLQLCLPLVHGLLHLSLPLVHGDHPWESLTPDQLTAATRLAHLHSLPWYLKEVPRN